MSVASGLGAFNKDKVANKFGIQLRAKESSRPSTPASEKKLSPVTPGTVTKNQSIGDFRSASKQNGFPAKKSVSSSVNKPAAVPQHSTGKAEEKKPASKPGTTTTTKKNEAQLEQQQNRPLDRRQSAKPLEQHSPPSKAPVPTTTTTTPVKR